MQDSIKSRPPRTTGGPRILLRVVQGRPTASRASNNQMPQPVLAEGWKQPYRQYLGVGWAYNSSLLPHTTSNKSTRATKQIFNIQWARIWPDDGFFYFLSGLDSQIWVWLQFNSTNQERTQISTNRWIIIILRGVRIGIFMKLGLCLIIYMESAVARHISYITIN